MSRRLYLATLSDLDGAPVFICPDPVPTARSAIKVSSVSPDLWDITVLNLFSVDVLWHQMSQEEFLFGLLSLELHWQI